MKLAKLFLIAVLTFSVFNFAQAQDNVGLLPTNPFYFLKEWRRDIKGFFTVRPVKRAELELQVIREKSAEIKKLQTFDSSQLKLEKHIADLMERAFRQVEFYFESGQKLPITETAAILPFDGGQWENFAIKLSVLLEKKGAAGVLWAKDLEKISPESGRKAIGQLKENLLLKFFGQAMADNKVLESLPKESLSTVEFLDDLKEYAEERTEFKNHLNQIRQETLNWTKENKKISRQEAEKAIVLSENLASALGENASLLKEKANFNLAQAKVSLESFNFGDAFGQASLASAAATKALNHFFKTAQDFEKEIKELKAEYDRLSAAAKESGLDLKLLFNQVEKLLAKAADLLSEKKITNSLYDFVNEAKILLAEIAARLE